MAKGDVFHGTAGRKATSFIAQRRQISWLMEPGDGDIFHGSVPPDSQYIFRGASQGDMFQCLNINSATSFWMQSKSAWQIEQ
jgi:hypothetical protein